MTICSQCNGGKSMIGAESLIDLSANSQTFQGGLGSKPGAAPCSQCGGNGYY